ncbi:MAG: hypothetical protein ABIS06_15865 [Vicinamibacterales bacterium]
MQIAASEGKAKKTDFGVGGLGVLGLGVAAGGYTSSDEGKLIAVSFRDNYNIIVQSIRTNPTLLARAAAPKTGSVFNEGDVLRAKIAGVQVLQARRMVPASSRRSDVTTRLCILARSRAALSKCSRPPAKAG